MKNFFLFACSLLSLGAIAQVQLNNRIEFTGSGNAAKIEGIDEVTNNGDAANKVYVDTAIANRALQSLSMNGDTIFISGSNYLVIPGLQYTGNLLTVQIRLDNGETPIDIYNSDNDLLDEILGATYQGGLIYYLNTSTGEGLIIADSDQSGSTTWGCPGIDLPGASGTAIGTGAQNTQDIISGCATAGIAARVCDNSTYNSYSDWFLPARLEMNAIYTNLLLPAKTVITGSYWTSSEYNDNSAIYFDLGNGSYNDVQKGNNYKVRCSRAF